MLFKDRFLGWLGRPRGGLAVSLRDGLRHPGIVPIALCLGTAISLLSSAAVRGWERVMAGQKAAEIVQEQVEKLQVTGLRSMEVLYSIASLHEAQGGFDRAQFRSFVQQALSRQPELRALSWNPRVPDARRADFETAARSDGLADFQFRELNSSGQLGPASRRPEYVPVYFIEPLAGNSTALGYDLGSDVLRRNSVEEARDSGRPVATAPVHLAQEPGQRAGFLVLLPVYGGPPPLNTAERRQRLAGFAVAVFQVADLVGNAFGQLEALGIHARLFDQSSAGELIYASPGTSGEKTAWQNAAQSGFQVAGRRWVVEFAPTPRFTASQPHEQSRLVLFGGLGLTLLLTAHLFGGWRRTREIASANASLQEEVAIRQKAEAEAGAANQAKSDFLASMSHEIRTPLNAILGYTQLMQHDAGLSSEHRDAISGISGSGRHLIGLINEILDLSKIEAGRMELNPVNFDLSALGRGLEATFRPLCAQKRIGLRFITGAGRPALVRGDEGKLRQVLINLTGNAVKFTRAGEVCLRFKAETGDRWLFEVVDTGLGIPEEERDSIFKPFHQGSNAAHQGGTGLGLAIAQRQVELLGGTLEVQSERGIGSRFHFTIPLPQVLDGAMAGTHTGRLSRLKPGQRVAALVVDDRKENRDVLGGMLALAGCDVSFAEGGHEALEAARSTRPDIVFLDLVMPGMDGVAAARALLSDSACGHPKIVAHSAAAVSRNRERARDAGCVDFLAKPIQAEQVHECLRVHLGVEFDYVDAQPESEALPAWEDGQISLPEELLGRLTTAAELHSATTLKHCLRELHKLGPQGRLLAEHIRQLMRSYDMDGILRLISRVAIPAPASAAPPAHDGFTAA